MKRVFFFMLAMLAIVLASGCVGIKSNPNSALPNNSPAAWENTTFGVPL